MTLLLSNYSLFRNTETRQFFCDANKLTGFYMIQVLTEKYSPKDYNCYFSTTKKKINVSQHTLKWSEPTGFSNIWRSNY